MVIPLSLRSTRDGRLVYGIPLWYRIVMGLILAVVAAALFSSGDEPGAAGWIVLALTLVSFLYDERWAFDEGARLVRYRSGLLIAARRSEISFDALTAIALKPFVRGTIPGSKDEADENKAALEGGRGDDGNFKLAFFKKPYLCLVLEAEDGARYFVDAVPARKLPAFKEKAAKIAAFCGKSLVEGP